MHFQQLNQMIRETEDRDLEIVNCQGQRYIGSGLGKKHIRIRGVPGNALGAYLDGAELEVFGNAQDATGDTMNAGSIVIHGSSGDATGYAMRGGRILVEGDACLLYTSRYLEEQMGCPIRYVSVGAERDAYIEMKG